MSIQHAQAFIRAVADDAALRDTLLALPAPVAVRDIVAVAAEAGFDFDEEALVRAHGIDWSMRWLRYHRRLDDSQ
ncbi:MULTISPECIES: Nif11-like leader peptide family natural product precursor [unclassified Sphingomonas]|uniref:Nif11-like leader peptide family natural product precursor n=1 Tax=unclassified Sphingomonas TaxID=196159 RepID=UPI00082D77E8|nr:MULTISPECIES: Nif11-like leader peptide family natural product precursor [unclassified Sphingomonas]